MWNGPNAYWKKYSVLIKHYYIFQDTIYLIIILLYCICSGNKTARVCFGTDETKTRNRQEEGTRYYLTIESTKPHKYILYIKFITVYTCYRDCATCTYFKNCLESWDSIHDLAGLESAEVLKGSL